MQFTPGLVNLVTRTDTDGKNKSFGIESLKMTTDRNKIPALTLYQICLFHLNVHIILKQGGNDNIARKRECHTSHRVTSIRWRENCQ